MKLHDIPANTNLKTARLLLRYPKITDAVHILNVVKSPQFPEQLPLKEMNAISEIEGWLQRLQDGRAKGRVFSWILEDRETGNMLGQVTLSKMEGDDLWALAFWTDPQHWGKGYATEGAARVLAFGFEELGAKKIWAGAGEWNTGSWRVLEKLGMDHVRNNPKGYYSKGQPILTREYEISRETWNTTRH